MGRDKTVSVIEQELASVLPAKRRTRSVKAAAGALATPNVNEVVKLENRLNQFVPTDAQKDFLRKVENNVVTFITAPAGTGKTAATLWYFCKQYLRDPSLEIVVTRTPAEVGKDKVGFLPDGLNSKIEPHYASTRRLLQDFIGKEKMQADFGKRIHFTIPNYLLGSTMDNRLWLIDEAQLMEPIIMKLLLERIGKNTKVIISGSSSQIYTGDKGRNGMCDAMSKFFNSDDSAKYENFAMHRFSVDDVMRSDVVKSVLRAYGDI